MPCVHQQFSSVEIERIQKGEPKKEAETYLDLFSTKNVRVKERVLIPVKQYPRVSEPLNCVSGDILFEFGDFLKITKIIMAALYLPFLFNLYPPKIQFNFVGKILGPQGNTIKRLQEDTGAKISVLGRGSMRDKNKVRNALISNYFLILVFI